MRKVEFECRKCGTIISVDEDKEIKFCPAANCNTYLSPRPQPSYWLSQFNPKSYRSFDRNRDTNEPEQWLTSQHANHIKKKRLRSYLGFWDKIRNLYTRRNNNQSHQNTPKP